MEQKVQTRKSFLGGRKIAAVFLPILIFLWVIGWTLTQIGSQGGVAETRQKTILDYPEFETYDKSEMRDEDSEVIYKPEIAA